MTDPYDPEDTPEWQHPQYVAGFKAGHMAMRKRAAAQEVRPLPESMSRDEMLRHYSNHANVMAHEALRYQKRILDLQRQLEVALAKAAQHPSQSAGEPVGEIISRVLEIGEEVVPVPVWFKGVPPVGTLVYASPPPTDAARASGVPVIKYGPLYEYAEGRGLDYNELCSLVRSVVSCRTMKDQTK